MAHYPFAEYAEKADTAVAVRIGICPKCRAQLTVAASPKAAIDACGFESHSLECRACRALLAGIVDPADDALLLGEIAA